jgi:hypothetical protein
MLGQNSMYSALTTRPRAIISSNAAIPYAFDADSWLVVEDEELAIAAMYRSIYLQRLAGHPISKLAWESRYRA